MREKDGSIACEITYVEDHFGTTFIKAAPAEWFINLMAESKANDIQSWQLVDQAVNADQIDNDQALYALIEIKNRIQQTH